MTTSTKPKRKKRRKAVRSTYTYVIGSDILRLDAPALVVAAARRAHERVFGALNQRGDR